MELSALGTDKRNHQDIFKHCRQFERTFQTLLNEANVAFRVRAVVEGHLPEMLYKIPIEKRFNKNYTREICREADGVQPHLVSPEAGIKRLVVEAMKLTEEHVHRFVDEIHIVLIDTVKEAARNSMNLEVGASVSTNVNYEYLRLKGFENAVIIAATQALEEWRTDAHSVASKLVQMECDYVTPSFFREMERQWQEESSQNGDVGSPQVQSPGRSHIEGTGPGETGETSSPSDANEADDSSPVEESEESAAGSPRSPENQEKDARNQSKGPNQKPEKPQWKAGWLDKRAGDSANLSTPVESWKWQKRWFVLSVESGILFYYSSPDDVNKKQAKVAMNIKECAVEDLPAPEGQPLSLLIRLQNRNPNQKVTKQSLILRASDLQRRALGWPSWAPPGRQRSLPRGLRAKAARSALRSQCNSAVSWLVSLRTGTRRKRDCSDGRSRRSTLSSPASRGWAQQAGRYDGARYNPGYGPVL